MWRVPGSPRLCPEAPGATGLFHRYFYFIFFRIMFIDLWPDTEGEDGKEISTAVGSPCLEGRYMASCF